MIQLGLRAVAIAVARNQAHRLLGGAIRGGHRTQRWSDEKRAGHERTIVNSLWPHLGPVIGRIAVEIGPGDSLNVCRRLIAEGCDRVYAVEKYAATDLTAEGVEVVRASIVDFTPDEPVDLILSHDVLEHVDVSAVMASCERLLAPGGRFVSSVDLRGHNAFNKPSRPLDFLTCPDWLYRTMHSHIETSNRVRPSELVAAAEAAGLTVELTQPLEQVDADYLKAVRPHLLPRYRDLPESDLSPTQLVIVATKPEVVASPAHPLRPPITSGAASASFERAAAR